MRFFFMLLYFLFCFNCSSSQIFVSPSGNGDGSASSPASIINGISLLNPGDSLEVTAGEYITPFAGILFNKSGTPTQRIVVHSNGGRAVINGTFKSTGSYVDFIGLVFTAPNIYPLPTWTRFGSDTNAYTYNLLNKLIPYGTYTFESSVGTRVINNIFYNSPGQVEAGSSVNNIEFYGNVFANLGCNLADNESGEGIYVQNSNTNSYKFLSDNIFVNNALAGADLWSQTSAGVYNVTFVNNVAANNGSGPKQGAPQINLAAALAVSNCVIANNILVRPKNTSLANVATAYFGRSGYPPVYNTFIVNNYLVGNGPMIANLDSSSSFVFNKVIDGLSAKLILNKGKIDNNNYYSCYFNQEVDGVNIGSLSTWFKNWQNMGYDTLGFSKETELPNFISFYYPNKYQSGRGFIVVVNPKLSRFVRVDLASFGFNFGDTVYFYNAFDMFNQVLNYRYVNSAINIDTSILSVVKRKNTPTGFVLNNPSPYVCVFLISKDKL